MTSKCARCGRCSNPYDRWPTCRACGEDICPRCDVPHARTEDEDHKTLCRECWSSEEGADVSA